MATRRSPQYLVEIHTGQHRLNAATWHRYVSAGLLRQIDRRIARPARNVVAWLENGELRLTHTYFVYTSWLTLNRISPVIEGQEWEWQMAEQYGTKDFWKGIAMLGRFAPGSFVSK